MLGDGWHKKFMPKKNNSKTREVLLQQLKLGVNNTKQLLTKNSLRRRKLEVIRSNGEPIKY